VTIRVQESGIKNSKLVVLRTRTGPCLTAHNPVQMIKIIALFATLILSYCLHLTILKISLHVLNLNFLFSCNFPSKNNV